jgi:hypothetical protein
LLALGTGWRSARAQPAAARCDPRALSTISASTLRVPPPGERPGRCLAVGVTPLELGPAIALPGTGPCRAAVLYRRVISPTETCGYDVYYEPRTELGVVILRADGARRRPIARGTFDVQPRDLAALRVRDVDGDGTAELVLDDRFVLVIEGRAVRSAPIPR